MLTSNKELRENIRSLSYRPKDIVFDILLKMKKAGPNVDKDKLINYSIVKIDWDNITSCRSYKSKVLKELKAINFMVPISKDSYIVNPSYINPFNAAQLDYVLKQSQIAEYEFRTNSAS